MLEAKKQPSPAHQQIRSEHVGVWRLNKDIKLHPQYVRCLLMAFVFTVLLLNTGWNTNNTVCHLANTFEFAMYYTFYNMYTIFLI